MASLLARNSPLHGSLGPHHSRRRQGHRAGGVGLTENTADKKWIDGACALRDNDGDVVFSTFDTRDLDKSQPKMDCGTHIITGGTGKYKGITGSEPFACINMPALAGPGGYTAMDIPHNTAWEIKQERSAVR